MMMMMMLMMLMMMNKHPMMGALTSLQTDRVDSRLPQVLISVYKVYIINV
jgi:hypothetical protein